MARFSIIRPLAAILIYSILFCPQVIAQTFAPTIEPTTPSPTTPAPTTPSPTTSTSTQTTPTISPTLSPVDITAAADSVDAIAAYVTIAWGILAGFFVVILLLVVIGIIYHNNLKGSDPPNWLSLALHFVALIDFVTDVLFFGELYQQNNSLTLYTALFLCIPHGVSFVMCITYFVRWNHFLQPPPQNLRWTKSYSIFAIMLTLFCDFYGCIELVNSQLFHLRVFNMQISQKYRTQIQVLHVFIDVSVRSFPLMIIQMAYMSMKEYQDVSLAIIAMAFSFTSIAIGIFIVVSKLCGGLVEMLIPDNNPNDNLDDEQQNRNKRELKPMYRLMVCRAEELKYDKHYLYSHQLVATAWSTVLQISEFQVETVYISNEQCEEDEIKFKIEIQPERNDENLYLFLNLLETPSSGLYDLLKLEIHKRLCLSNEIAMLQMSIHRTDALSLQPVDEDNKLHIEYHDIANDDEMRDGANGRKRTDDLNTEQKWKCEQCTFENFYLLKECEVCHAEKPVDWNKVIKQQQRDYQQSQHDKQQSAEINALLEHHDLNVAVEHEQPYQPPPALADDVFMKLHAGNNVQNQANSQKQDDQLFQDIAEDNQHVSGKDGVGVWTGDLVVDEEHPPPPASHDDDDAVLAGIHTKDIMDAIVDDEENEIVVAPVNVDNIINDILNEDDEQYAKQQQSNNNNQQDVQMVQLGAGGIEISEIDDDGNNYQHVVIAAPAEPADADVGRVAVASVVSVDQHALDEDDEKQDEVDEIELFDNRYTNDGLNDDFDDLREPDVFG